MRPFSFCSVFFFLSAFVGFSLYHHNVLLIPTWTSGVLTHFFVITIIYLLGVSLLRYGFNQKVNFNLINIVLFSVLILAVFDFQVYFSVALVLASSNLIGSFFLRDNNEVESEKINTIPQFIIRCFIGVSFYLPVFYLLAHFKINYRIIHLIIWFLPILLLSHTFLRNLTQLRLAIRADSLDSPDSFQSIVLKSLYSSCTLIILLYAMLPESMHDAVSVYLPIFEYIKSEKWWHFNVEKVIYANMSMGPVWLQSSVYILGGELSAKLLNWLMALFSALLIYHALLKLGAKKELAVIFSLLFISTSVIFLISVSLFYDSFLMGFISSAFYLLVLKFNKQTLLCLSLLCGAAVMTKISALFAVTPILLSALLKINLNKIVIDKLTAFKVLTLFLLSSAPPYTYAYLKTQNPFFPLLNNIFKSPLRAETAIGSPLKGKASFSLLYDMTFNTGLFLESFIGGFGFHFLLLLPLFLVASLFNIRNVLSVFFLIFLLFLLIQVNIDPNIRYLVMFMPIMLILGGATLIPILNNGILHSSFLIGCLFLIGLNLKFGAASAPHLYSVSPFTSVRESARIFYQAENSLQQNLAQGLTLTFQGKPKILAINTGGLGTVRADIVNYNWYNEQFVLDIIRSTTVSEVYDIFKKWGLTHVLERQNDTYANSALVKQFLKSHANLIFYRGGIKAYQLSDELIFPDELIVNGEFDTGIDRWELHLVKPFNLSFKGAEILPQGYISQNFLFKEDSLMKLKVKFICKNVSSQLLISVKFVPQSIGDETGRQWTLQCFEEGAELFEDTILSPHFLTRVRVAISGGENSALIDSVSLASN